MDERSPQTISRFFDRRACCSGRARHPGRARLRGVSRVLVGLLDDVGTTGRTVLDAGCGQGEVTIALGQRGASGLTGIDLSRGSISAAKRAAEQAGVPARFAVADAATDTVQPHDVVVLHRVVCCYFDPGALLANALPAARTVVALSLPHSRGLRGALARAIVVTENAWRRLRGDPFRAFVHDEDAIVRTVTQSGLSLTARRDHAMWQIATFQRMG